MSKRTAERMEPENDAQKCDEDPQRASLMLQMLSNEMLIEVFEKLSVNTILNLMLTCKRIYNFVNSSPRILQKITFKVNYKDLNKNNDQRIKLRSFITIMRSCRRFACVNADEIRAGDLIHLAMLIQGFADDVKDLSLKGIVNKPCLADLLSSLPNLVKIRLLENYSPEIVVDHQLTNLPQLLHLKELRVNKDFNLFDKARNLEIVIAYNISSIRFLTDTIWKQRHLKSLYLFISTELATKEFLDSIPNEVCMSLRKLKINIEYKKNLQPLVKFLKTQNELEELQLKIKSCVIDRDFLHTLLNMKSLRDFTLKFHNVPAPRNGLQCIQNETKIESLTLELEITKNFWPKWSSSDLDSFVNLFTNAQELKIVLNISEAADGLNEHNTPIRFEKLLNLKEFSLSVLKAHSILGCFSNNCLKSLLAESNSVEIWKKFAPNNPNIVNLTIGSNNPFNDIVPMLTEELQYLKCLELNHMFGVGAYVLSTQVLDAILNNCQNLEYLHFNNFTYINPLDKETFERSLKEKSVKVRIHSLRSFSFLRSYESRDLY